MTRSKRRSLVRCRNRAAAGPTIYVMHIGGLSLLVPHRALMLDLPLTQVQAMVRDYRRRNLL